MVFEVDFWNEGITVHFDGEEAPIAIYGYVGAFTIRTWAHCLEEGMLSIFDDFDEGIHHCERDGAFLWEEVK